MRRLGINYYSPLGLSATDFASAISECGFGATFTEYAPEKTLFEYANAFAKHNIAYETIHAPFDSINDMWLDKPGADDTLSRLCLTVDACKSLSVPVAVVHLSSGVNAPSITDIGRYRFKRLVEYAAECGVKIAFENQRKLANIAWAFEEFENYENVGFCWDVGHEGCFAGGREYMPLFGKRLICTHIHDNDLKPNHDLHMIPFDGRIDFYKAAKQIKANGFAGTLMLELMIDNSDYYVNPSPRAYIERAAFAAKRLRDMIDN